MQTRASTFPISVRLVDTRRSFLAAPWERSVKFSGRGTVPKGRLIVNAFPAIFLQIAAPGNGC